MSYFGKVYFGNDSDFANASEVAEVLRDAGYDVNEHPENGQLYFNDGEE